MMVTYTGCTVHYNGKWRGAFPEGIQTGRHLARETDWLGSPGGGCGGAIFKLKKQTSSQIEELGLGFFQGKTQPRDSRRGEILWRGSTLDDFGQLKWAFQCVSNEAYNAKIRNALANQTAYLGEKTNKSQKTKLLVLPEERLIFVGYWD